MAKLTLSSLGTDSFQAIAKYNDNADLIEAAVEKTLSRDGTAPNEMEAILDMNSNRIINLPTPVNAADAVPKSWVESLAFDGAVLYNAFLATIEDLTALGASDRTDNMVVAITSGAGTGTWKFDADSVATANIGTVRAPDTGTGRWLRVYSGTLYLEWFGGGVGTAAADQIAFTNAAALGQKITLKENTTYYMTQGVTPATGFSLHFETGAKIVLVTKAFGSSENGFKNYSGLAADRNSTSSTAFMLTVSGATVNITGDAVFESDAVNQPILRPIYANGVYLNIFGNIIARYMNTSNGSLSLNQMLGGYIGGYDLRATANMVDIVYTNLTNYSPAGIVLDDEGTFRSSRLVFGPGIILNFNRDASGADPYESDGITIGGIDKALRSGAKGGHTFGPIRVENVGEGVDCFQNDCVFEAIYARSVTQFGVKFAHGAQRNIVKWVDIDTYGIAAIDFAGSSTTTEETKDNTILDGFVRNGGKIGTSSEVYVVLFQDGGGTGYAQLNHVTLRQATVDSDTDYLAKDNHSVTASAPNKVRIDTVVGSLGISAAITTVAANLQLRVGGSYTRLTMSANQTGISSATYTTCTFNTATTDLLSEAVTASNKIRIKYPGRYLVRVSVRLALNALSTEEVELRILKNGVGSAASVTHSSSGSIAQNYVTERFLHVTENEAGTADADYRTEIRVVSAGAITITNTALLTFFEIISLD